MTELLKYGRQKTIVVTGADRGLGLELVKQYLERGERVFAGKYRTNWKHLDTLLANYPETLRIVELDVGEEESVNRAAKQILAETDSIDLLINNAGIWLDHNSGSILDEKIDYEAAITQFNVNALGAIRVTHALIQAVLNSFDKLVVNISSEAASMTECKKANQFGYCMSKAALNMASCITFNSIHNKGGAVINLHPGWMQSVIGESIAPDAEYVDLPKPGEVTFYTTPEITAKGFLELLDEPERFARHMPGFINYRGDVMNW